MNAENEIYLDHIAASPVRPAAVETMTRLLCDGFGNPQSVHERGQQAADVLLEARSRVAALVGADPQGVIFTATGSEANNLAVRGIARGRLKRSNRIIVSAVEHVSVSAPARILGKEGFELVVLPVDGHGLVSPDDLARELGKGAALVSILHASTEIGTIEPIADLAALCRDAGVPMHTDAWGTAGAIETDIAALGVDAMTVAAQNFGGPPGAAALVVGKGTPLVPLVAGGIQERGKRAGQENIPAIAGMGVAAALAAEELPRHAGRVNPVRDRLLAGIPAAIDDVVVTGHPERRLPGHASVCVRYVEGEALLLFLDQAGIRAASGSACTSKSLKGSSVLEAIGLDAATAQGSLVFSAGPENTVSEADRVIEALAPIAARLREMSPLYRKENDDADVQ